MCYAISTGSDPFGPYYRYEFIRPLFPDYPRPAVWPDAYYVPTSTGDEVIQKHTCAADRARMLEGKEGFDVLGPLDIRPKGRGNQDAHWRLRPGPP